mmetsp:Transcript_3623/g.8608  ORF Transcript_3623/g.8608 Transcript_3623/m.8608 type:complete len:149 (-) Transcript_3623:3680-4126(-)
MGSSCGGRSHTTITRLFFRTIYYRARRRWRLHTCIVPLLVWLVVFIRVKTLNRGTVCGASRFGFIRAGQCHPYSFPSTMSLSVSPKGCGKLSEMRAGFCLCDDDATTTTIAAAKGCGSKRRDVRSRVQRGAYSGREASYMHAQAAPRV